MRPARCTASAVQAPGQLELPVGMAHRNGHGGALERIARPGPCVQRLRALHSPGWPWAARARRPLVVGRCNQKRMWVARAKRRQLIKHRPILSVILFGVGYTRYREDVDENYPGEENPSRRPCVPQMSGCPHASNRVGMAGKNRRSVGGAPERPRKSWDAFGASISGHPGADRKSVV